MVRSLYSGVAGMTTHQTKMDVIGNNISNVSTYGYKSSRAAFRDVYYQTNNSASAATATSGGTNPTQIGYGAKLGSVDVNHSQSVMSTTGYGLDIAIAGEGYIQVMDADNNIFYTKAGMLDIDADGNLVDINGYFVLGVSGDPAGVGPSSNKIQINLPYESAASASATDTLNDRIFTISATNQNEFGNVSFVFATSTDLPIGQKAKAVVSSDSIVVTLNSLEEFANLEELEDVVNDAIKAANGGMEHQGGYFNIELGGTGAWPTEKYMDGTTEKERTRVLTGADIVEADFGIRSGSAEFNATNELRKYFNFKSFGDDFGADFPAGSLAATDFKVEYDDTNEEMTITLGNGADTYTATLTANQLKSSGTVLLKKNGTSQTDSVVVSYPSYASIKQFLEDNGNTYTGNVNNLKASATSPNLGLGNGNFVLKGGTAGGAQSIGKDLQGLAINDKGVITATHESLGVLELGRVDLAKFDNPAGLSQVGNTYFAETANSGEPIISMAGKNGTGDILGRTLETSNVDLANEFADMITTQRGFQACSRMITVSDTMLEELINLKR